MMGVFGIGSPFGADNVAEQVIVSLKQKLDPRILNNRIQIEYFDRPGMHLLEYMQNCKIVHLIDAIVSGQPVGTIHRYENIAVLQKNNQLLSSHGLGVAEVLMLGERLQCLPESIIIHGVEIDNNHSTHSISDKMRDACHELAAKILGELTEC